MNSYEFHIGDYYRRTSHLSQEEHYIYRRLIDQYFLTELPISTDLRMISRQLQLTSDQIEILETILSEYFDLEDDGWNHDHVKQELERIYGKSEQARNAANRRWEKEKKKRAHNGKDADAMRPQCEDDADAMLPPDPLTPLPSDPETTGENKVSTGSNGQVPIQQIINKWNVFAETNHLPKVVKTTTALKGQIRQRWTDIPDLQKWDNFFSAIESNDFLAGRASPGMGRNKPFRSTLLWITKETNFAKIAAGEYD